MMGVLRSRSRSRSSSGDPERKPGTLQEDGGSGRAIPEVNRADQALIMCLTIEISTSKINPGLGPRLYFLYL